MKNFYLKRITGVVLIELLIVIAIIAILIGVLLPSFKSIRENQVLKSAVSDVVSAINKAKSESISSVNSLEYGVHFETNKAVIFTGTTYSALAGSNIDVDITSPASISLISLSGGGPDLYFDRLSGAPNKTGSITISTSSLSKIITVSATGAVSTN